jgi:hypothetical protein
MLTTFVVISVIIFFFFGILWKKENYINLFIKVLFVIMAFFGAYLIINGKMLG